MKTFTIQQGRLVTMADQIQSCTSFKFIYETFELLLDMGFIAKRNYYIGVYDYAKMPLICVHLIHINPLVILKFDEEKKEIILYHTKTEQKIDIAISSLSNNTIVCV